MDIAVLGPVQVNGSARGLSPRDRVVLAALVAEYDIAVSQDTLADALWGDSPPSSATKIVQGCVVRLRKLLGQDAIATTPAGYALRARAESVDSQRFARLISQARERLAAREPDRTSYLVDQALALWRGAPLTDLEEWPPARVERRRLEELLLDAEDLQTEAALRLGRHRAILGEAICRAEQAPLRERRWWLLALAQYRTGSQADALLALSRAKAMLVDELGLEPSHELAALEVAILNQDPALDAIEARPEASAACPYPGLLPFGVEDEASFFGRQADVAACLDRLESAHVLAVVGPSGCGKSSLVRAGVAAALQRDGRRLEVVTPGSRPLDSLVGVASGSMRTVLVVDQAEEGLAEEVDNDARQRWVDAIVEHGQRGDLVIALRSDRVGALAAYPALARLVERGLYLLGALGEVELRGAIEGPAGHAGLRLEQGLVDLLVRDVRGEPGALPLLSHVLRQTWLRREGSTLTVAGYRASGGVRAAVAQSADGLYEQLEATARPVLRDLMLRLVALAPDGEPTRSRLRRSLVADDPTRAALVEQLVSARLVSIDEQSVEIAHEALAREWPRLRAWLEEDVEGQRILRHLTVAADSWEAMGRPDSELYRGVRLARALEWQAMSKPRLSPVETAFLHASDQAAATERDVAAAQALHDRRANRRLRVLLGVAAAFAVVAAALGTVAGNSARNAAAQALSSDARRVGAEALTAPQPDTSLLLAAAGMRLEHNSDAAKSNLAAALDRSPLLARVVRTPPVESIAVDPRSGQVAVSLTGGGVNLYDGQTLRPLGHSVEGGGGAVTFSPDGRMMAVSSTDLDVNVGVDPQPIHLLDSSAKALPVQLGGIPPSYRSFWSLSFSGDGRRLAAPLFGYSYGRINLDVWDVRDPRRPVAVVHPQDAHMTSVAISRDGRTVYTTGDYYLRVFDAATGTLRTKRTGPQLGLQPLPFHDQAWTPLVLVSPDGNTLALSGDTEVALLDPDTLKIKARLEAEGRITSMAFSADSRRLAIADGGVSVWDLVGKAPIHVFTSPDGDAPRPTQAFRAQTWGGNLTALSPDGKSVYGTEKGGVLLAWDLTGAQGFVTSRARAGLPNDPVAVQVSPDGRKVAYLANIHTRVDVRDVDTGRLVKGENPDGNNTFGGSLTWRPDGRAVTGAAGDAAIGVADPSTGAQSQIREFGEEGVSAAQYTSDGKLVIGTIDGHVQLLNAGSLDVEVAPVQPIIDGPVRSLALDPAEHAVAVEGTTKRVLVDYRDGHPVRSLSHATFFAPDGTTSAVVDDNGAVGFQSGHSRHWITSPDPSHAYGGNLSAYSHDSSLFASSHNGQVGLWNARTGTFLGSVPFSGQVALGFTADDSTLVLAGFDGTLQTWNLRPDAWIRTACDIAGRDLTAQEWSTVLPGRKREHVCDHSGA